ncbi:hypothetical protein HK102_005905 [Quaeritorhiza haematococci]|nr:hypothetical protein HK102_005905 [Quaeritorhiza haematococci]
MPALCYVNNWEEEDEFGKDAWIKMRLDYEKTMAKVKAREFELLYIAEKRENEVQAARLHDALRTVESKEQTEADLNNRLINLEAHLCQVDTQMLDAIKNAESLKRSALQDATADLDFRRGAENKIAEQSTRLQQLEVDAAEYRRTMETELAQKDLQIQQLLQMIRNKDALLAAERQRCEDFKKQSQELSNKLLDSFVIPSKQVTIAADLTEVGRGGCGVVSKGSLIAHDIAMKECPRLTMDRWVDTDGGVKLPLEVLLGKTPAAAKKIIRQLVEVVGYIHGARVAHIDIKPANMLVNVWTGAIKLIDFGLSMKDVDPDDYEEVDNTTSEYGPPQYHQNLPADPLKFDMWEVGVTAFRLCEGCVPYRNADEIKECGPLTFRMLTKNPEIRGLVQDLLKMDPAERPSAASLKERYEWLRVRPSQ